MNDRSGTDRELAYFVVEVLLIAASIVLLVHFRGTTATVFSVGTMLVAGTVALVWPYGQAGEEAGPHPSRRPRRRLRPGDYRATSRDLFRVERVAEDRAVIEDCRTGVLIDVDVEELDALRVVPVARGTTPPGQSADHLLVGDHASDSAPSVGLGGAARE